jgi:hypothetical protein
LVLVVLASALDGAFIIGIKADFLSRFLSLAAALVAVEAGSSGGGFFEEEG